MPNGITNYSNRDDESKDEPSPADIPLAISLSPNQFVGTASDRQHEAKQYTGHNFVAISNVCRFASRADVEIYDDRMDKSQRKSAIDHTRKRVRKSLVNKHGHKWKSFAKDESVAQHADPSFRWWKLAEQPNPWQTGSQVRYTAIMQMRLHGIAFIWNVKNKFGKTVWRVPVPLALCTPIAPGSRADMPLGGISVHSYGWMLNRFASAAMGNRAMQYMASREISINDLTIYSYPHPYITGDGASPTTAIDAWIQLAKKAEKSQSDHYDRGPDKKVMVQPPEDVKTSPELRDYQKRLDKQVRETDTGVVVAPSGGVHDLTTAPDEMAYDQGFGDAIMAAHGVPKAAVGASEGMTYGSVAATLNAYGTLNVQADLDTLADEDTLQMREEEGPAFSLAYPVPPFDDLELTETQITNDLASGAVTTDEFRIARGLKPFGGARGQLAAGSQAALEWNPQAAGGAPGGEQGGPAVDDNSLSDQIAKMLGRSQKSMVNAGVLTGHARPYVIAIDLDGTLAIDDDYDEASIPAPRMGMVEAVRAMKTAGCGIVVYTCRDSDSLVAQWMQDHDIPFDAININPWSGDTGGKMLADLYLDDRAVSAHGPETAVIASVLDQIDSDDVRAALRDALKMRRFTRLYGFLFAPVENGALRIVTEARAMIDPEHLTGSGIEDEPHVTLLHQVAEKPWDVTDQLRAAGRFQYEVGPVTVFREGAKAHVVVRVLGESINGLRRLCESSLSHVKSEHGWNPHITIGVIDSRYAELYEGRELSMHGQIVQAGKLVYRPPGEPDLVIPLR
jgi:hypothetical protein